MRGASVRRRALPPLARPAHSRAGGAARARWRRPSADGRPARLVYSARDGLCAMRAWRLSVFVCLAEAHSARARPLARTPGSANGQSPRRTELLRSHSAHMRLLLGTATENYCLSSLHLSIKPSPLAAGQLSCYPCLSAILASRARAHTHTHKLTCEIAPLTRLASTLCRQNTKPASPQPTSRDTY